MIDDLVRKAIMDAILKVVMGRIIAALPFLSIPIIGPILAPIIGYFVGKILNLVADELILMINMKVIEIRVSGEVKDYEKTVDELKVELAKPVPDEEALRAAKEKLKKSLHDLVNFGPAK